MANGAHGTLELRAAQGILEEARVQRAFRMYQRFGITLMLTHVCNLRCTYCYTGEKTERTMPLAVGKAGIDRAIASLASGGTFDLAFFGGEPLLQAGMIITLAEHARQRCRQKHIKLNLAMTTNGTITTPQAWSVMSMPDMHLSISYDGLPEVHDRHRVTKAGHGTSRRVLSTMRRLAAASRAFRVVVVVRPDTLYALPESIRFLQSQGVRCIQPSLDLWTQWSRDDVTRLREVVARCARIWRQALPELSVAWFDEKVAHLAGCPVEESTRCGFGQGEIAVAPSGRLYPCERLIGEDNPANPMAIPGHALGGTNFHTDFQPPVRSHAACAACAISGECNTLCRCSNYVRTGDVATPDGLLCAFNQACMSATADVLNTPVELSIRIGSQGESHARCTTRQ